jgi:hypothetical protein
LVFLVFTYAVGSPFFAAILLEKVPNSSTITT